MSTADPLWPAAVESGIAFLHDERERDPNRGLIPRLRRAMAVLLLHQHLASLDAPSPIAR